MSAQKYRGPNTSPTTEPTDVRSGTRRSFDSLLAKSVRLTAIVLGVYAPVGILMGVVMLFGAVAAGTADEELAKSNRRVIALYAAMIGGSGSLAGYVAYQLWKLASNVRRANRRRAKGLDRSQVSR